MKSRELALVFCCLLLGSTMATAQKTIKDYVEKNGLEKIKKSVTVGAKPQTAKGFGDGHGSTPLLTSSSQLPDTLALITFYIYDLGFMELDDLGNAHYTTYHSVSPKGGNKLANEALAHSIADLKVAYKKQGVVLLTPDEFLNTDDKRNYYYKQFKPNLSRIGKVLSGMETAQHDIAVVADGYRPLDNAAAADYLRAESLGADLASKLGVDGVLSISVELMSNGQIINMHGVKMTLNGSNPIRKEDKKYVGQKLGTGYYAGQTYATSHVFFKKPIRVAKYKKKNIEEMKFEGVGQMMAACTEKMYDEMKAAIEKAAGKYK